jgi:Cu-Zn family superoxide dismutase
MKTNTRTHFIPFFLLLALICCLPSFAPAQEAKKFVAKLSPSSGSQVTGTVTFTAAEDAVEVVVDISGLKPGKHGLHIHEKGDCSAPDASSAGGHFNPTHSHHGGPTSTERHIGDFGNVEADASGKVHVVWKDKNLKLSGEESIVGKSVVVHEKEDDLKTDPAGNSGARFGCGVIEAAK